jgi:hypothetical protein
MTAEIYKDPDVHQMNPADPSENRAALSRFTLWRSTLSFHLGNLNDGARTIKFVRDLDTNMSNANAQMVLNALGIPTDDELCGHMNRVQFANLCASWLQQHIGRPSAKIEMSVTRDARGPTFIDCGVPALLWVEMGLKSLITASSSQSWQASHRLPANGDLLAHSVTGANCRRREESRMQKCVSRRGCLPLKRRRREDHRRP